MNPTPFITVALITSAVLVPGAQPVLPKFEVASVRASQTKSAPVLKLTEGRFDASSVPLTLLVQYALGIEEVRLLAPDWLKEHAFDVQANLPAGTTREQVPGMVLELLKDRFQLVTHKEFRMVPVYELLVGDELKLEQVEAADDRAVQFKPGAGDTVIRDLSAAPFPTTVAEGSTDNERRTILLSSGFRVFTSRTMYEFRRTDRQTWDLVAERMSMDELARELAPRADRPVIDRTGLTGLYRFTIELPRTIGTVRALQQSGLTTRTGEPIEILPSGVSIFSAVERLGLELLPKESQLEVVVVDRIDSQPTEN